MATNTVNVFGTVIFANECGDCPCFFANPKQRFALCTNPVIGYQFEPQHNWITACPPFRECNALIQFVRSKDREIINSFVEKFTKGDKIYIPNEKLWNEVVKRFSITDGRYLIWLLKWKGFWEIPDVENYYKVFTAAKREVHRGHV